MVRRLDVDSRRIRNEQIGFDFEVLFRGGGHVLVNRRRQHQIGLENLVFGNRRIC